MQFIKHFSEIEEDDLWLVGGKGLNLGKLTRSGFSVPQGFCITTDAYRSSVNSSSEQGTEEIDDIEIAPDLIASIQKAREELRGDRVAVRSSATAEDLAEASFAGQQDTFLNVKCDGLLDAIKGCWSSLWSDRAIAYRRTQGIPDEGLAMAVVVQEMCQADVSGVLFTVSPFDENLCVVESNWGLGESVVSGSITPDNFQLLRETGEILHKTVAVKQEMITESGIHKVSEDQKDIPSLTDDQLRQLCEIGIQVEQLYVQPMDIEWGLSDSKFVLFQARPITTRAQGILMTSQKSEESQELLQTEIQALKVIADAKPTVWSHHNLAEVLPTPLPMTWEIMREFMSGLGGLGSAYRGLGFYPSKRVNQDGILDLICGRVYVNLNREAELFFEGFPFAHDFAELKRDPQKAMYAQAKPDIKQSTASFWLKFPLYAFRMSSAEVKLRRCRSDFDKQLMEAEFPKFQERVKVERKLSYSDLTDVELVERFKEWCRVTLDDFAPKALTATLLAGFSLQRLEASLLKCLDETKARELTSKLISGQSGNLTVETNEKLWQVGTGRMALDEFLIDYGHRALNEFELAQPRWREDTTYIEQIIASYTQQNTETDSLIETENQRFDKQMEQRQTAESELSEIIKTKPSLQKQIDTELDFTRRYMPFRETAKFYLMLGYEQIRRALIELDNRYELDGGIFYLVPEELDRLIDGEDFSDDIVERKTKRELLLQIEVPDVIFNDTLDSIGMSLPTDTSDAFRGVGVSGGVGKGQARVLLDPSDINPLDRDYILVCSSTDPAWTPLFLHAAGLVMERGGLLSHGAVVAREYGVPAVVSIPNATQNIVDGQILQVDGNQGTVSVISS